MTKRHVQNKSELRLKKEEAMSDYKAGPEQEEPVVPRCWSPRCPIINAVKTKYNVSL